MIKINHNVKVRFKLDPDFSNKEAINSSLQENGFYEMQLWDLLEVYNKLARMRWTSPFEGGDIFIIEERGLTERIEDT